MCIQIVEVDIIVVGGGFVGVSVVVVVVCFG